ncbi:GntR family transcriptional regulator [Acidothermaceae bacterium B102]|nr:GntR family transcriptional regulator [Acidothermaceae bacterium B102]
MVADLSAGSWGHRSKRQQLPEQVAAYVRELIVSGAVRPGEFLRMDNIAQSIGVSNTPVREGLLTLSSQGFVRQIPRRGFVVAPFTQQDIYDLFWAQARVAGELAFRAAKRITPEQLARLEDIDARYHAAEEAGANARIVDLGHAFHREVNLAADSIRLAMLLGSVVRMLPLQFYATIEGGVSASHAEHPAIVAALRARNAKASKMLMEQHISDLADRLVETLEKGGLWKEADMQA